MPNRHMSSKTLMKTKNKIVIASGKGGVGKSMLASSLAMLFARERRVVAVDCDVDAPNLHLWLGFKGQWDEVEKISTNEIPIIGTDKCNLCGKCKEICAFGAISIKNQGLIINNFFCEGCGACEVICPQKAIVMKKIKNADIKIKNQIQGFPLVSAQLYPGQTGSGKVVEELKNLAEKFNHQIMILDSPAGTGCPVIASLQGADFALLVTEPTPSGLSDLKRVLQVVRHFKIPFKLVINKWDINKPLTAKIAKQYRKELIAKISYDKRIFKAISGLTPILQTNLPVKKEVQVIFRKINTYF